MFSEDLELKGGILSQRKRIRSYLGIKRRRYGRCGRNCVLRKGGDVERRGGSGEKVAG